MGGEGDARVSTSLLPGSSKRRIRGSELHSSVDTDGHYEGSISDAQ